MSAFAPKTDGFAEFCFPCRHVIFQLRPVKFAMRDGLDWVFACGEGDHDGLGDWGYVHTHHLLDADGSLSAIADLKPGEQAARYRAGAPWLRLRV